MQNSQNTKFSEKITIKSLNCSRNNIFRSSFVDFKCRAFVPENSICIYTRRFRKRKGRNLKERVRVPNSNLVGWFGMEIELPEIRQGLDFASSGERGLALTDTWILSILTQICSLSRRSASPIEIFKNINLSKILYGSRRESKLQ